MIYSMTGFGAAEFNDMEKRVYVEARSVNNRFLKLNIKSPEFLNRYEQEIENCVKEKISRGTVTVIIEYKATNNETPYRVNANVLETYYKTLQDLKKEIEYDKPACAGRDIPIESLITLPGVVERIENRERDAEPIIQIVYSLLRTAMEELLQMRAKAGAVIQKEIKARQGQIESLLKDVEDRIPEMLAHYTERLHQRISTLLKGSDAVIGKEDLHKEVAIFAERSDITEEIKLLRSHIAQLEETMDRGGDVGKKLEFIVQEMFREANTMASKSNDEKMLYSIVNIKAEIEKIKELVLNVE